MRNEIGYIFREWNYWKVNENEKVKFSDLSMSVQDAYYSMGYTEESHNCCNAHYKGVSWSELPTDVTEALYVLGSDQEKWDDGSSLVYENAPWVSLSSDIQDALGALCHTKETWHKFNLPFPDGVILPGQRAKTALMEATTDPTASPTANPTASPTGSESPTGNPTASPTESPTKTPTGSPTEIPTNTPTISFPPTVTAGPSHSPSVSLEPTGPTPSPTAGPTKRPTPRPSHPPSLSPTISAAPTVTSRPSSGPSVYTKPPVYNSLPEHGCREKKPEWVYFCPVQRYCKFNTMNFLVQLHLTLKVGYSGMSDWDYFLPATIDNSYWEGLPHKARQGLKGLGYDEDSHDCCNLHYWDYDWADITSDGYQYVWYAFEMLGYDEEMWNGGENPEYYDYDWDEMPQNVTDALFWGLCYTKETWDFDNLWVWPEDATLPGSYNHTLHGQPTASPTEYPTVSEPPTSM